VAHINKGRYHSTN